MLTKNRIEIITKWIFDYCKNNNKSHLIIGISGGIDSAVTSTLCAKTGLKVVPVSMPILQHKKLHNKSVVKFSILENLFFNQ